MQPLACAPFRATVLALAAASLGTGCAGRRARLEETRPPEVLVEVLPRGAEVALDGRVVGRGGGLVPIARDDAAEHVIAVTAPGFVARELELPPGSAGARVGVALSPHGLGGGPVDLDEPEGLAAAAAVLLDAGASADAADYAARAVELEPRLAPGWRLLGDARHLAGDRAGAAEAWDAYLRAAPLAPDANDVARRAQEARGEGRPRGR